MENNNKRLESHEVFDMVKFIVNENFNHHEIDDAKRNYAAEINSVYDEELTYGQNSEIHVERDNYGSILGTIRVLKWNLVDPLPVHKIFGINPLDHVNLGKVNDIFHFGRFAIRKNSPSLQLFKKLIAAAIAPVCQHRKNVAFAECDSKLFRTLSLLGIKMKVIGEPVQYLGSETIPVMITYKGLIGFYSRSQETCVEKVAPVWENEYRPELAFGV